MSANATPRHRVEELENARVLLDSRRERFFGYGVMGLPFDSGHILALRRFPHSSIGPGYTSIWHRSPEGRWCFFTTVSPELSCPRYAGEISDESRQTAIDLDWVESSRLRITCQDPSLVWDVRVAARPVTTALNAVAQRMPRRLLGAKPVLRTLGPVAGAMLGTGSLALVGMIPNGQDFQLVPSHVWEIVESRAELNTEDLGTPAPLPQQAAVGDFLVPQHGLLAIGNLSFALLDPSRHSTRTSRAADLAQPAAPS